MAEVYTYNPALMKPATRKQLFVDRGGVLEDLLDRLAGSGRTDSSQHYLLIGPRGIGKSMLLWMVDDRLAQNRADIETVMVQEDHYHGIASVTDLFAYLYLEVFGEEFVSIHTPESDTNDRLDGILDALRRYALEEKVQFVFLIDNLEEILNKSLKDEKDRQTLRAILQTQKWFTVVGAAITIFDEIKNYNEPLYRFFYTIHLSVLNDRETAELIDRYLENVPRKEDIVAGITKKIQSITTLTGGYPRLILMACDMLKGQPIMSTLRSLDRILNDLTPYYQARLDGLSDDQRTIIHALMVKNGVATVRELQTHVDKTYQVISKQLKRLIDKGVVRFREPPEEMDHTTVDKLFECADFIFSDQLFMIWYQMRVLSTLRQKYRYLIEFIRLLYPLDELEDQLRYYKKQCDTELQESHFERGRDHARTYGLRAEAFPWEMDERLALDGAKTLRDVGALEAAFDQARTNFKRDRSEKNWRVALKHLRVSADILARRGELKAAQKRYERLLDLSIKHDRPRSACKAYLRRGALDRTMGDRGTAIQHLEHALDIAEDRGYDKLRANIFRILGKLDADKGDMENALKHYRDALEIDREIGCRQGEAAALGNIGRIYRILEDYNRALRSFTDAFAIFSAFGAEEMTNAALLEILRTSMLFSLEEWRVENRGSSRDILTKGFEQTTKHLGAMADSAPAEENDLFDSIVNAIANRLLPGIINGNHDWITETFDHMEKTLPSISTILRPLKYVSEYLRSGNAERLVKLDAPTKTIVEDIVERIQTLK